MRHTARLIQLYGVDHTPMQRDSYAKGFEQGKTFTEGDSEKLATKRYYRDSPLWHGFVDGAKSVR